MTLIIVIVTVFIAICHYNIDQTTWVIFVKNVIFYVGINACVLYHCIVNNMFEFKGTLQLLINENNNSYNNNDSSIYQLY